MVNNKQLHDMPDEILEEIFNFLDFGSKKRFSLVSKKFNQVFGLPKNLNLIKFRATKKRAEIGEITRPYRHIEEPGYLISADALKQFTNLTSYIVDKNSSPEIEGIYFVDLLPYFGNLSSLNIIRISQQTQSLENHMLQIIEGRMGFEVVEMKHLRTLKIGLKLFLLLNDRYVKFPSELQNLKIINADRSAEEFDFASVKSLITSQKHLKMLSLSIENQNISQMFDTPFIIRGQLKVFKLNTKFISDYHGAPRFNSTHQDHLADFLMNQRSLEKLEILIGIATVATSKMQHMMNSRHRMPLVQRRVFLLSEHLANVIDFEGFTIDELAQANEPNQATKRVNLQFYRNTPEAYRAAVDFVSIIYPGLISLEILGYEKSFDGIEALNELKHMESLKLPLREFETSSAIRIPTLKKLHIVQHCNDSGDCKWHDVYKTNLKSFFQQHKLIEEIVIEIDGYAEKNEYDKMDSIFHELIENALMQLHSLRKFNISVLWFLTVEPYSHKVLTQDWTSSSKFFAKSMKEYAKGGFVLLCGPTRRNDDIKKLMKTFDGAVVEIE